MNRARIALFLHLDLLTRETGQAAIHHLLQLTGRRDERPCGAHAAQTWVRRYTRVAWRLRAVGERGAPGLDLAEVRLGLSR